MVAKEVVAKDLPKNKSLSTFFVLQDHSGSGVAKFKNLHFVAKQKQKLLHV